MLGVEAFALTLNNEPAAWAPAHRALVCVSSVTWSVCPALHCKRWLSSPLTFLTPGWASPTPWLRICEVDYFYSSPHVLFLLVCILLRWPSFCHLPLSEIPRSLYVYAFLICVLVFFMTSPAKDIYFLKGMPSSTSLKKILNIKRSNNISFRSNPIPLHHHSANMSHPLSFLNYDLKTFLNPWDA